jgi:hypothetical protein
MSKGVLRCEDGNKLLSEDVLKLDECMPALATLGPALAGLCKWRAVLEDGWRPGRTEQSEVLGAALVLASKCWRVSRSGAGALRRVGARGGGRQASEARAGARR